MQKCRRKKAEGGDVSKAPKPKMATMRELFKYMTLRHKVLFGIGITFSVIGGLLIPSIAVI